MQADDGGKWTASIGNEAIDADSFAAAFKSSLERSHRTIQIGLFLSPLATHYAVFHGFFFFHNP
jgi:hypothetical protein